MSSKHHLHTAASIPAHLTPADIIAALHDHNTALTLQALTTGHTKADSTAPETLKDTYWYPPDQYPINTYNVKECITWFPGVGEFGKKYITFPSCFQDTKLGIKTRADASGVIVRAEFRVVRGGAGAEVEGEGMGVGDAEWVLVEDVEVSCSWWLMPFVKGKMEQAHRDVCRKVVEKVEMQKRQEAVASSAGSAAKGKGRLENGGFDGGHFGGHFGDASRRPTEESYYERYGVTQREGRTEGLAEADATETQRVEMPAPLPEKITYR
ncbi:Nn.00g013140.m01.CDS01 [Neocucurbitaria sp. VM-36]